MTSRLQPDSVPADDDNGIEEADSGSGAASRQSLSEKSQRSTCQDAQPDPIRREQSAAHTNGGLAEMGGVAPDRRLQDHGEYYGTPDIFKTPPPKPVSTQFPTSLARVAQVFHRLQDNERIPVESLSWVLNFVFGPFLRGRCARPGFTESCEGAVYVCVGYLSKSDDLQSEMIIGVADSKILFSQLRKAVRKVLGWPFVLSLKSLQGFGLYEVNHLRRPECQQFERHKTCELNPNQDRILQQLYHDCMSRTDNKENLKEWADWIQDNLNLNDTSPVQDRKQYSIGLRFVWSKLKISAVILSPLLLSLAIGFWYMKAKGDVVAAWTISLYIVTTAAAIIALLTVLSSIGHR